MAKIATLNIFGNIEADASFAMFFGGSEDNFFNATKVQNFIDANKDADELHINLRTRGGDVDEGYAIKEALIKSGKKITIDVVGYVYSIGTVILAAANKENTTITTDSEYLAHCPYTTFLNGGTAEYLQEASNEMLRIEDKIANTIASFSGMSFDDTKELMKKDSPISGKEAVERGLVGKLIDTSIKNEFSKLKAVAYSSKLINLNQNKMGENKLLDAIGDLKKLITNVFLKAKNMDFTDVNGKTFTVEREDENIAVGDKASPDGTFELPSGKKVVIAGGVITEITEPASDSLEDLKKENERLKKENDELKGKVTASDSKVADLTSKVDEMTKTIEGVKDLKVKLESIESLYKVEVANFNKKDNEPKPISVEDALKEIAERRAKRK